MTRFEALKRKMIAAQLAKIDRMTEAELLAYATQVLMPWEERNVNGPMMTARRHALARLDRLTAPK